MSKRILIVDDAIFMRNILKKILVEHGYEIVGEAENSDAGVQAYKDTMPDMVTMDICMPEKSGMEAIKEIIQYDENAKILVCSSLGQELLVMESIELGAKDFLVKPFKKAKLIDVVSTILEE